MASLLRLFQKESDVLGSVDNGGQLPIDPWRAVIGIASKSQQGFVEALPWLCLFARSGVDIPVSTYMDFSTLARRFHVSLTDALIFVEGAMSSIWLRSMGRQKLQSMFSSLHSRLAPDISHRLQTKDGLVDASVRDLVHLYLLTC